MIRKSVKWISLSLLFLLFALFSLQVKGNWTPQIVTYSRNEYKAGSQNWQITQRANRWIYFANKAGILEFNGIEWSLYPFDNSSDGRSLLCAADNRRIYVGGINEFGYLEPDETGQLLYTNLSVHAPRTEVTIGNVWKIYEVDNAVYFCGDNLLVRWTSDSFQNIPCPDKVDCSGLIKGTLFIGTKSGLYVLAGETFYPVPDTELLTNKKLRAIIPLNNDILVASSEALYLIDSKGCHPFTTEVDTFLLKNGLFSLSVSDQTIAIGTVLKGVVMIDHQGKALDYFNESHGLRDNTVLSLFFDADGNLWLGQDNGIGFITLHHPIKNLYTHPNFYGSGYVAELFNNKLYLGTNRGLYTIDWLDGLSENAPQPQEVSRLQGQVWSLTTIDNKLLCCMDTGLFIIDQNNHIDSFDLPTGVWSFRLLVDNPNMAWISTYSGFYTTVKKGGKWEKPQPVEGLTTYTIINYEEIAPGVLLLRNSYNEFVKVTLNASRTEVTHTTLLGVNEIPANSFVYRAKDKVVCCTRDQFYEVDDMGNLKPDKELNSWTQATHWNISYKSLCYKDGIVCVLSDNVLGAFNEKKERYILQHHAIPLIANFEELNILNDSLVVIPNENGFALWDMRLGADAAHNLQIVKVNSIKTNASLFVHSGSDDVVLRLPYKENSLRFYYHFLDYAQLSILTYSCQLDDGVWTEHTRNAKEYENIGIGKHLFRVKVDLGALNQNGDNSLIIKDFNFIILPPWHRTAWAYGLYGVLCILFFLGVWYLEDQRIRLKNRQLELKQKKQIRLKEQEINQLKTERLELEVKHKNQELANTAINLARKNEVLTEIKDDLLKVAQDMKTEEPDMSSLRRKILILNNKITENILQDDSLKKFEEHFDLVHSNFMEHLTKKFPDLTANERKMCAFIKMNLSSKEIAPLLSISIRGVETLRYRLRKKIGLKQEDNLTSFLNKF